MLKSEYGEVYILYVKQLTDVEMLTQNVIRPIQKILAGTGGTLTAQYAMERVVAVEDCKIAEAENEVLGQVLNGMTFILFPNDTQAINVNLKRWKKVAGVGGAQLFNLGREGFVHGKTSTQTYL